MKKFVLIMAFCAGSMLCMGNQGCDKATDAKGKADNVAGKITFVANGVTFAVDAANPVVKELEKATGIKLDADIVDKGAKGANAASDGLGLVGSIISAIPGGQAVGGAITALSLLCGGVGVFLESRKKKKSDSALKTIIKATDIKDYTGIGKVINDEALKAGNADHIKAAFVEVQADKAKEAAA